MRSTANPLSVNFGFLGNHREIIPGSSPELYISIKNRGERHAVIDLSIEATNEESSVLNQWISPRRVRLALDGEENKTVSLQIQIPENAWPQDYHYDVVIDAPEHYPEYTPLHYPQILKVLPTPTTLKHGGTEDPVFFLSPTTNSSQPKKIKPGETFEVEILVENRTPLVDRFHLVCSDLKPEYFSVYYPEVRDQYGLITTSDGLELNPGQQGTINLKFHPPYNAPAGNYYPTIRLTSVNNPRLSLLNIVYLHVPPAYELELEIETIKDRIKDPKVDSGEYRVNIVNQGNVERNLVLKGRNRAWGGLLFTLDPDFATIAPGEKANANMLVKPIGRWWNRPFFGVGRDFRFSVDLEDMRNLPIPQELPQNKVTWEPYPRKWLVFFIVLLSLLGVSGAIALAIVIWNLFLKQPLAPEVVELAPSKTLFREANNEVIQLNWQIKNAKGLDKLVLVQQGAGANDTKTFDFKEGIPVELSVRNPNQTDNYCDFQTIKQDTNLVCHGIMTSARKPGEYQFELQVFNKNNKQKPVNVLKTDTIRIAAAGLPKIMDFSPEKNEYLINEQGQESTTSVLLNWEITNPAQISQMQLVGLARDGSVASPMQRFDFQEGKLPKALEKICKFGNSFSCRNVPMNVRKAGLYVFRLSIEPKHNTAEEKNITRVTDAIQVKAIPSIKIPKIRVNGVPTPNSPGSKSSPSQTQDKPGQLIDPSQWPPESSYGGRTSFGSSGGYQQSRPYVPPISAQQQRSIQQANDVSRGLLVADNVGEIKIHSQTWRKVQDTIYFLRGGSSLISASQRSGVSMSTLTQLIAWGQGQELPTRNASVQSPTSSNASKPPEPLWGKPETPVKSGSKVYKSNGPDPLW